MEHRRGWDNHLAALRGAAGGCCAPEPELRRSCLNQTLMFGAFSAAWTRVALLTGPAWHLGPQAVGLLALVGPAAC